MNFEKKLPLIQELAGERPENKRENAALSFEATASESALFEQVDGLTDGLWGDLEQDSLVGEISKQVMESVREAKVSLQDKLLKAKYKLAQAAPDFVTKILADHYVDKYRAIIKDAVETSRAGGALFNVLAKNRRLPATDNYQHDMGPSSLESRANLRINGLEGFSKVITDKLLLMKEFSKLTSERLSVEDGFRTERQTEDGLQQTFHHVSEDGTNALEEQVTNIIYSYKDGKANYCQSDLFAHNDLTGRSLDLGLFLPQGYHFCPEKMRTKIHKDADPDNPGKIRTSYYHKDLRDYAGSQAGGDNFSADYLDTVYYGNLEEKGGKLSLLHEIAHAWHIKYRDINEKSDFEDFYGVMKDKLLGLYAHSSLLSIADKTLAQETNEKAKRGLQSLRDDQAARAANDAASLKEMGAEVSIELDAGKAASQDYSVPNFDYILIKADRLTPLIEGYVASERDAWAHAIRVLRFLRQEGIDLEPELKTPEDFAEVVHHALATYQNILDLQLNVPPDVKRFTVRQDYVDKVKNGE